MSNFKLSQMASYYLHTFLSGAMTQIFCSIVVFCIANENLIDIFDVVDLKYVRMYCLHHVSVSMENQHLKILHSEMTKISCTNVLQQSFIK